MSWPFSAGETATLITATFAALFLGIGQIITLYRVKEVHELTNSRLARIEGELALARADIVAREKATAEAEKARINLAHEAATAVAVHAATTVPTPIPVTIENTTPVDVVVVKPSQIIKP